MNAAMSSVARFTDTTEEGRRVLRFQGDLTLSRLGVLPNKLDRLKGQGFLIDLSGIGRMDTIGAWIVHRTARDRDGEIVGAGEGAATLLRQVEKADQPVKVRPDPPAPFERVLTQLGEATVTLYAPACDVPPGPTPPGPTTLIRRPALMVAAPVRRTSRTISALSFCGSSWPNCRHVRG